jgi:hypothetical protein
MTPLPLIEFFPNDRRASRRYGLALNLRYKITKGRRVLATGGGVTCDMSTRGIAFTCEWVPFGGTAAELSINWPIELDSCPLLLMACGRIVRVDATRVAIVTTRHEFRLAGNRTLPEEARAAALEGLYAR